MEIEHVEGMQFDSGYVSAYMVTDPARMEATWEDPKILVTDKKNFFDSGCLAVA